MVLRFGVFALDLARLCRETTIIHLTPKAIASMRPDPLALGGNDIWAADRVSKNEPFGPPKHLDAPVNSAANDFCPTPIHGSYLLFGRSGQGRRPAIPVPDVATSISSAAMLRPAGDSPRTSAAPKMAPARTRRAPSSAPRL